MNFNAKAQKRKRAQRGDLVRMGALLDRGRIYSLG